MNADAVDAAHMYAATDVNVTGLMIVIDQRRPKSMSWSCSASQK
jgi:hypothetical protein